MSQLYPLPRSTRENSYTATEGQTVFGPPDWILFDLQDVEVAVKEVGEEVFMAQTSGVTVAAVDALPGLFTVTFATGLAAGDQVRLRGLRVHERQTNVTQGGAVRSVPLETELDRQAVVMQELRRDVSEIDGTAASAAVAAAEEARDEAQAAAQVAAFQVDASGPIADRSLYDDEPPNFIFVATDEGESGLAYIRQTETPGTWSPGLLWGRGPQGVQGSSGPLTGRLDPGQLLPEFSDTLSAAYLWANYETIGNVGSGADHQNADYYDAFQKLKNTPWNNGDEDWAAGETVYLPDMREVILAGAGTMGGAASPAKLQRATTISTTLDSNSATVASAAGLTVGMYILTTNVPGGATITAISGTTITMSANATGTASGTAARFSLITDPQVAGAQGGLDVHQLIADQLAAVTPTFTGTALAATTFQYNDASDKNATAASGSGVQNIFRQGTTGNTVAKSPGTPADTISQIGGDEPHPNLPPVIMCNWKVFVAPAQEGSIILPIGQGDLAWTYDKASTADAAPGDGKFRLDDIPSAAGFLYWDNHDAAGNDLSPLLARIGEGDTITIFDWTQRGRLASYEVSGAPVAAAGYYKFPLDGFAGASADSMANDDNCIISVEYVGPPGSPGIQGIPGTDPGILYLFDASAVMGEPGDGDLRFNNVTLANATALAVDYHCGESGNPDLSDWVKSWDDVVNTGARGTLEITKRIAPQNFVIANVNGAVVDNVSWLQVPIHVVQAVGSFTAADALSVKFTPAGADGAGTIGGSTGATARRVLVASGTGGSTVEASPIEVDASANVTKVESLGLNDSDDSHQLVIKATANLTANRDLNINTGDAARTLIINGDFTMPAGTAAVLAGNQQLTGGHDIDGAYDHGTVTTTSSISPEPRQKIHQKVTLNAAVTLTVNAPTQKGELTLILTMGASAAGGAVSLPGTVTGDTITFASGDVFWIVIRNLDGTVHCDVWKKP